MTQVGYCAAIARKALFYQGFFIQDTPELTQLADELVLAYQAAFHDDVGGALQGFFMDCTRTPNLAGNPKILAGIGAASLALRKHYSCDYFIVRGVQDDSGGWTTSLYPLEAASPSEARDLIEAEPDVLLIKMELLTRMERPE
jgi:hypothetical protein